MNLSEWVEAGIILIFVKALLEPTAVEIGQRIFLWLDTRFPRIPDYLTGEKDND